MTPRDPESGRERLGLEHLYRAATAAATPLMWLSAWRSGRKGGAPPLSLAEKMGRATQPRPAGPLLWLNGPGLGELIMAQPVVERILAQWPAFNLLITPKNLYHRAQFTRLFAPGTAFQCAPFNTPAAARRFFAHWRPDFVLWIRKSPKPNLMLESRRYGPGHAILQADIGEGESARQRRVPTLFREVYGGVQLVGARSAVSAERYRALGVTDVLTLGDLRSFGPPLSADPGALEQLRAAIGSRPRWVAASTRDDE